MSNNDTVARITQIMSRIFDNPGLVINRATTAPDVKGWDSLSHINLIVAIEREFRIRFKTAEVTGMKNVGDLIDLIVRKSG